MWHFASLPFAFLVLTTLLQLMFLTARRGRQTSSGRMKGWVGPLRRSALQEVGGMRDEEDGGPSCVLRCEARLATAFGWCKICWLFFSCPPSCCSIWGQKTCKYWCGTIGISSKTENASCANSHKFIPLEGSSTLGLFALSRHDLHFEEFAETSAQSSD